MMNSAILFDLFATGPHDLEFDHSVSCTYPSTIFRIESLVGISSRIPVSLLAYQPRIYKSFPHLSEGILWNTLSTHNPIFSCNGGTGFQDCQCTFNPCLAASDYDFAPIDSYPQCDRHIALGRQYSLFNRQLSVDI